MTRRVARSHQRDRRRRAASAPASPSADRRRASHQRRSMHAARSSRSAHSRRAACPPSASRCGRKSGPPTGTGPRRPCALGDEVEMLARLVERVRPRPGTPSAPSGAMPATPSAAARPAARSGGPAASSAGSTRADDDALGARPPQLLAQPRARCESAGPLGRPQHRLQAEQPASGSRRRARALRRRRTPAGSRRRARAAREATHGRGARSRLGQRRPDRNPRPARRHVRRRRRRSLRAAAHRCHQRAPLLIAWNDDGVGRRVAATPRAAIQPGCVGRRSGCCRSAFASSHGRRTLRRRRGRVHHIVWDPIHHAGMTRRRCSTPSARIVQALRESSRLAEQQVGLSGAQLFVLQRLAEAPGVSVNELAARPTRTRAASRRWSRGWSTQRARAADASRAADAPQRRAVAVAADGGARAARPDAPQDRLIRAIEQLCRQRDAVSSAASLGELARRDGRRRSARRRCSSRSARTPARAAGAGA